jgi:putative membrane protein
MSNEPAPRRAKPPEDVHLRASTVAAAELTRQAAQNTSDAATNTQHAANQTAVAAHAAKSSAERTTELAADRTVLAFERTYAAWVRTGLVALASGIGARKLLEGIVPPWMTVAAGSILLVFSAFCFGAGVWRHLFKVDQPDPNTPKLPSWIFVIVNGFLALVAIVAMFAIMLGGGRDA